MRGFAIGSVGLGGVLVGALALGGCGGKQSGAVLGQADLLAEDDVVDTPVEKGGLPPPPEAPAKAGSVTAGELTETRCLGFVPEGGAFLALEERHPGEKGPTRVVRTVAAGAPEGHGLPEMELGRMAPEDETEDEMFGDGLELSIGEHLDAVNGAITERGLWACQSGIELAMGAGGFRRKVREMAAFPGGEPYKVVFRDGAVFAGPADGASKEFGRAPDAGDEDAQFKLTDVWFTTLTPGIVAVISDASSEQAKRVVVFIPTSK